MRKLVFILTVVVLEGCYHNNLSLRVPILGQAIRTTYSRVDTLVYGRGQDHDNHFGVNFQTVSWQNESHVLKIQGTIFVHPHEVPPLAAVYIGPTKSLGRNTKVIPTAHAVSDSSGKFEINSAITDGDKLIFIPFAGFRYRVVVYELEYLLND